MQHYSDVVANQDNVLIAGATVTVFLTGTGTKAALFSDDGITALANPVTTNSLGVFSFFIADGRYDLQVSGPTFGTYTLSNVEIADVTEATPTDTTWLTNELSFVNQAADPSTPAPGHVALYTKANKHIFIQDDSGLVTDLTLGGGGGGGGGSAPGPPANSLQKNSGLSTFVASNVSDDGTNVTVASEAIFKGPNPYTDVRAYGVRSACASNSTPPCAPGITASILSGQSVTTLSSSSVFQNGDGLVIFGAGPAHSLTTPSAPTVTPSIAAAGTRTGLVVNAPVGATTYNYQVVARDAAGGLTAASNAGVTTTGGTLGAQTATITGFTRSLNIVTATTSAPHTLAVGAMVYITTTVGDGDNFYFGGWFVVSGVPNNTHFTYITGNDVANGALAVSQGGGTAHWWNCNHLSWTPVPNTFLYYIYGRSNGSMTLLGVSTPQTTVVDATWDDFGATMMGGFVAPYFVPTTPPASPTSDNLVTTIVSGGGTNTLVLANSAGTNVANATILFDNAPNIQTAALHTQFGSLLYVPNLANGIIVNSYLAIPGSVSMALAGGNLLLNDTMQITSGNKLFGMLGAQSNSAQAFSWPVGGFITVNRANFGVFAISSNGLYVEGIQLSGTSNGQYLMVVDGASTEQNHWHNVNFVDGGGSGDYMGVNLLVRGSFWNDLDHVLFNTGPGQEGGGFNGTTATPAAIFNTGGLNLSNLSVQDRGIFHIPQASGAHVTLTGISRMQGGIMPFFTAAFNAGGNVGGSIFMSGVELDTMSHAYFANLSGTSLGVNLQFENMGTGPSGSMAGITGKPVLLVVGSNGNGTNNASVNAYNFTNSPVNVTGNGAFMMPISTSGAPALSASAGGSVPTGTISYVVTFFDVNGQESTPSAFTNISISSGTQTVLVTPPAAPVGAVAWRPYRCNANGQGCDLMQYTGCNSGANFTFSQTATDTFGFTCGVSFPSVNRAGAQSISAAGISGTKINLTGGGFKTTISGTFTGNHNLTLPDTDSVVIETGLTFATLGTPPNGTFAYCSDCTIASPCASGGTGAFAKRLGGQWVCN